MDDYRKKWETQIIKNQAQTHTIECYKYELKKQLDNIDMLNKGLDGFSDLVNQKISELEVIRIHASKQH